MPWTPHSAIRSRREQLGLSQSDLANSLGVTKSLLSHIECGKRQPTDDQIEVLSTILSIPPDLLLLSGGRLPADIRDIFQSNAAVAVAAVRQKSENKPISYPQKPDTIPVAKPIATARRVASLIPERIDVSKTSTSYRAHSYHTKVPPDAIRPFIRAFTDPGDTVFDPFCGSGMTGVAALIENRSALLSDFSPAAVHIARNYTTFCDPEAFAGGLARVEKMVEPTMAWLYRPLNSARNLVEYTTWSDVFRCPACDNRIVYWEAMHKVGGIDGDRISCTACGERLRKADLQWAGEEPVESHTSQGSNRIDSHKPTPEEVRLMQEAEAAPIPYWTPSTPFGPEREMWRAAHRAMGICDVSQFFTRRNLHGLAALRHAIVCCSENRVREALLFAFTACVNRASRRYQWNAKRPTNVMTGTLYISSLRYEWNVWSLFRRKASDVLRYYRSFPDTAGHAQVFQRSATDLDCLPDSSVDMVFMDPPFGSNIFYADSSLLWESWLGALTEEVDEIVVNRHRSPATGGKSVEDYGSLMRDAFAQAARVLKPSGRAVLAFSNSDDQVWQVVQRALSEVGLTTSSVHLLNKGQPSIKGVKAMTGKENVTSFDLMLCLERSAKAISAASPLLAPAPFLTQALREALATEGRRTDEVYSCVIRKLVEANYSVSGINMPVIAEKCRELGAHEIDSRWVLQPRLEREDPLASDFVAGYLTPGDSLPRTANDGHPAEVHSAIPMTQVSGGRGSTYYLAHSYHTKVPPEAITPFIEHYTKPGDVVLDPFCGSGMTGVAATLTGRKAILNDLSPAAVHLSWNHTRPCAPEALEEGFSRLEETTGPLLRELYQTTDEDGRPGVIHWTLWSTVHCCSECAGRFLLWEAIDQKTGRVGRHIDCPLCHSKLLRHTLEVLGSVPAWISGELQNGRRFQKAASKDDIARASGYRREDIQAWYPRTTLGPDREMYIRCALQLHGVRSVADFYTPRNLQALALIWQEISNIADDRIRRALAFAFTNTAWHGTRMRRFNARGGQRPLTGTLYIPQLSSEANVLEVLRNKIDQLKRYYRNYRPGMSELPTILLGSATKLTSVRDCSVDYVFTDPPFGSNIFYADCNLIWESWLGRLTDVTEEAVVNRSLSSSSGGKSLGIYQDLMQNAMTEISRVLKPGGWATVVFHNTNADVWEAIRTAATAAGFEFHEAASLDRQQQSHKGYKGRAGEENVAHFDVVFNLRKSDPGSHGKRTTKKSPKLNLEMLVAEIARDKTFVDRGLQGVHAEIMRRLASENSNLFVDYSEIRVIWERLVDATTVPVHFGSPE